MAKKIVSLLLLSLISLYAITSTGNIIRLVETVHHGWVAWTLGASLGFTLALSSFIAAMAQTRKLFVQALIVALLSGFMSAIFQTYMYMADGAEWYIAALLGFGIPLIGEVGLALLDAAYMEEHQHQENTKAENETRTQMEAILTQTQTHAHQVAQENEQLRSQLSMLQSQIRFQTESHMTNGVNEIGPHHSINGNGTQNGIPAESNLENPKPQNGKKTEKQPIYFWC